MSNGESINIKETLKVAVSGVRGVVGVSFTPQLAASFAQAFGTFVGVGPVVIGRDTRPTGLMIEQAVVAGLQSVGCTPILAGIAPTPTLLMLVPSLGARGGIAITASHNPGDWNALKFIGANGLFISESRAQELFDVYHQQDFPLVEETLIKKVRFEKYPTENHFKRILSYINPQAVKRRKLKVAIDCGNGVGALYSPIFLDAMLGCDIYPIFDTPSGRFEREPEPLPQHLGRLSQVVQENRCDIGFAQDPDGDRLAVVDDKGRPIGEDLTLALAVWQVLDKHERGTVCINVPTSKAVDVVAARYGCQVVRTRIGEINVAEAMLKNDAVVGGENIGGIMISKIHPCRDSFSGMAVILEMLAMRDQSVSEIIGSLPSFSIYRGKVAIRPELAPIIIRHIRHTHEPAKINMLDGLFVDLGKHSWVHIRRSNTESVMRITAEAESRESAKAIVDSYTKLTAEIIENNR
ncbi:MAG TPA: phosphoglucosamine mutase [Kiritimatiellia bacterium]|nr:phosphoglucosamine mutase [Kiritimatiellia bacterium]